MNKPWFAQYDEWTPPEIDPDKHKSVVEMLLRAGERFADKVAYSNFGVTKTYAETMALSRNFAAYLQTELGLRKGERVALMAPNDRHELLQNLALLDDWTAVSVSQREELAAHGDRVQTTAGPFP